MALSRQDFHRLALAELDALDRIARALTGHAQDAEDLVQETYARALRAAEQFELRERGMRPWLVQIMRNLFRDRLDARKHQPVTMDGESMDRLALAAPGALPWEAGDLATGEILAAMDRLPEESRTVLMLWAVDEMSYQDIAEALGIPAGTVMSRLHRARQRLAEALNQTLKGRKPVGDR
jgi:RNA polymerase sigma-70 factor, ECF subfamily